MSLMVTVVHDARGNLVRTLAESPFYRVGMVYNERREMVRWTITRTRANAQIWDVEVLLPNRAHADYILVTERPVALRVRFMHFPYLQAFVSSCSIS